MKTHTLDKERLRTELERRGWHRNSYGMWEVLDRPLKECEQDWVEAVEASVICDQGI